MKISNAFVTFFVLFSSCFPAHAHPPKAYIDASPGFFSGAPTLTVNGKEISSDVWSFGRYEISEAMKDHPQAYEYAQKHESYGRWAGITFWTGIGGALAYALTARESYNSGVYFLILFGGVFGGAFLGKAAGAYLFKAMNAYNGVEPARASKLDLYLVPVPGGAGVSLGYNFF